PRSTRRLFRPAGKRKTGSEPGRDYAMSGIGFGDGKAIVRKKAPRRLKKVEALSIKERRYLANRLTGKTKHDAAVDAGFSEAIAHNAKAKIEDRPHVRAALEEAVRGAVPISKFLRRLSEGLDATTVKAVAQDGQITDYVEVADYGERRGYLQLIAELGFQVSDSKQPNVTVPIQINVNVRRVGS